MRDHKKLRAFELADAVVLDVYATTRRFPSDERFALTLQLRRSAVSVACNIVEGCARATQADYVHFLSMAYGSARELEYQVSLSHRLGYLSKTDFVRLNDLAMESARVLNALIRSLRRQ